MTTRVVLYEEPGGGLIIRREGSPMAFRVLDFQPCSFATDAAQLAAGEVETWGGSPA